MATPQPERAPTVVPRGRHAPPLEVRLTVQRRRLFEAAAAVFARSGFAEATAEAISREAGMSKATFYEHFANKEECILALFDEAVTEVRSQMARAVGDEDAPTYREHVQRGVRAFVETLAAWPEPAQILLVEIIGAGPRAAKRRDAVLEEFAEVLIRDNARLAERYGVPTFRSREDAFGCIGASVELTSRQLRTGVPADIRELELVVTRMILGVLHQD